MNVNIRYKGFDGSEAVRQYVEDRSKKLVKFLPPTTTLNATLRDNKGTKVAEINFHYNGSDFVAKNESENMLSSIDEAIDKLLRQLSRAHDTKVDRSDGKRSKEE